MTEMSNVVSRINMVLLGILIAIAAWNLKKTQDLSEQYARMSEQIRGLERIAYKIRE
jgi:hypothetical protein